MAAPRIFLTGASGYIGGQILHDLTTLHPTYNLTALVRTTAQAEILKEKFPKTRTVVGDLASLDLLRAEAAAATLVIQSADCDTTPAVHALISGLASSSASPKGVYIQVSGAGSILESSASGPGKLSQKVWDDLSDVKEIAAFGESHMHWETDAAVLAAGKQHGIKTATMVPTWVYGTGAGPIRTVTSLGLPVLEAAMEKRGKGFTVGEGENVVCGIHVEDLSVAVLLIAEQALALTSGRADGKGTWGEEGIYYVEDGRGGYRFKDIVAKMVGSLKGKGALKGTEVDRVVGKEALEIHPYALIVWGANMRCRAERMRGLGWKAEYNLMDTLDKGEL